MAAMWAAPASLAYAHGRERQVVPRARQRVLVIAWVQQVAVLAGGRVGVLF